MIIFGTRDVKSTIKLGSFNCPQCEESRSYRHQKVTRFFILLCIPMIPLGNAGEYIECIDCKGTFGPRVLINNPDKNEFLAFYEKAIRHTMVLKMLSDGVVDDMEKKQVLQTINKYGSNDLSIPDLEAYINLLKEKNEGISTYLKNVGASLNEHGKEIIIRCALTVAAANGKINDTDLNLISKMGRSMKMSSSEVKRIMSKRLESKM